MDLRKTLLFALAATLLTTGCPGRDDPEDAGTDGGCTGVCTADGGQDAGPNPCAGVSNDVGTVTLEQLRTLSPCGQIVTLPNVVIHSITWKHDGGSGGSAWEGEFYVGAAGDAGPGIYVDKFYNDNPPTYEPVIGDRVNLKGFFYENNITRSGNPHSSHKVGYRREIGSQFGADGGNGKLQITFVDEAETVGEFVITNPAEFAAADGKSAFHDELRGMRVHLPGPVYITDSTPSFLLRYNQDLRKDAGEQYFLDSSRDNYEGYVVTGGIVVMEGSPWPTSQGRPNVVRQNCHYRALAIDAGSQPNQVVFPDGIRGVWDSYTMVPFFECAGGAAFYTCTGSGFIPSEDGGYSADRINVIWPIDCNDLDGGALAP